LDFILTEELGILCKVLSLFFEMGYDIEELQEAKNLTIDHVN